MAKIEEITRININKKLEKIRSPEKIKQLKRLAPASIISSVFGLFSHDVGIDLGTANTLVWVRGKGIVVREPSVIARQTKSKEILAIGNAAKKMLGKAPKTIEVVRPLKDGVIADFDATSVMLRHYIKKVHETGTVIPKIPKPRVVVGIPSGVTEVEKRAVADAAIAAGAREAHLVEEPMVAAIGADLNVEGTKGIFIVDVGGGTSEIAVISLGGIVLGRSIRIAGDELTESIINYSRLKYSLLLGETTAEEVKINIGGCLVTKPKYMVVRGRDIEKGLPKTVRLSNTEIQEALSTAVNEIIANIVDVIEETPPELISDIMEQGIYLTGGGALLKGLNEVIASETKIPVNICDDPLTCVVRGCGRVLDDRPLLSRIQITKGI